MAAVKCRDKMAGFEEKSADYWHIHLTSLPTQEKRFNFQIYNALTFCYLNT
jgi:hypothetical protein